MQKNTSQAILEKTVEWEYDHSKRMHYKHYSACCKTPVKQKMLYLDKIVTDPNFKIVTTGVTEETRSIKVRNKWYQFWLPKYKTEKFKKKYSNTKKVTFRYFCTKCNKQCKDEWEFKHE